MQADPPAVVLARDYNNNHYNCNNNSNAGGPAGRSSGEGARASGAVRPDFFTRFSRCFKFFFVVKSGMTSFGYKFRM